MGMYLNPGNDNFKKALRADIYIDKSELIAYTNKVLDSERGYLCVSRPRRFGKSMTANMLCAYYDRSCDSSELFKNLKISEHSSYSEHLNQYDVFLLNVQQFIRGAGSLEKLSDYIEKKILAEVRVLYPEIVNDEISSLPDALTLIYLKENRPGKGFIFIIDEWDCIFREGKDHQEAQKKYLDFLRDLLKDRVYVKLAYMTGILPIKKYGTHSALNIFDEFSMTDSKSLAEYVGFTEHEVLRLCRAYQMDFEDAKRWYDGYLCGEELHIYNPKSIVDAMYNRKFKSFWTRTETYEALKHYIDLNFDGLKDAVTTMLGGGRCRINAEKFQNDMTSFKDKDDVLTLLVHLGYLAYDEDRQEVFIPNLEIAGEFRNAVDGGSGWEHLTQAIKNSEALLEATLLQNEEFVGKCLDDIHSESTSILSYNNENSLSCVITLAYYSARKDYTLIREFPAGKGFADIVFLPRTASDKLAMIIELKWDKNAKGAVDQVKNKQYVNALTEYSGNLLLVGINYDKKTKTHTCMIEKFEK